MAVTVSVGKRIGVTVAGAVREGSRVAVEPGAIVGVRGTANCNAPHPITNRAIANMPIKGLLVIVS
jgi:hypothetical protein